MKNWLATETRRHGDTEKVEIKERSSLLAFLINSDLPFLYDSMADFAFFSNRLSAF